MSLREKNCGGSIYFCTKEQPRKVVSGPHQARIRLFEHEVDRLAIFWYGIAEVACTIEEIDKDAGNPHGEEGYCSPWEFSLRVHLDDGRFGWAGVITFNEEQNLTDAYFRLVFIQELSGLGQEPK